MDDVVIVGGGPAGAFAATILARAGARVRVFDRARFPRDKLCGDTLNPGALHVLAAHVPIAPVLERGLTLDGILLTGPGGVEVRGRYGAGLTGRAIRRRELDLMLIQQAIAAGAHLEDNALVTRPVLDLSTAAVRGIVVKGRNGTPCEHRARVVVAADGRQSRLARALGLSRHPRHPRRWAIGAYFEDVEGLMGAGEMHVRRGHYIGVAPMPEGLANACLVVPYSQGAGGWPDPATRLIRTLHDDARLAPRFRNARMLHPVHVLGPMAVDATRVGAPGLLMAGDAAGFIDPMTGDGLRFALSGAVFAASATLDVLAGHTSLSGAVANLASRRRAAFGRKWRFNRAVRALVASAPAVAMSAAAARILPFAFEAMIRYAGDCDTEVTSYKFQVQNPRS